MTESTRNLFLDGKVSVHDSINQMYERIHAAGLSNVFDRYDPQVRIRCNYCVEGVSCQLCTHGPCRISDKVGAEAGVCGIDRNAMPMRNMLLRNAMGTATYSHHAYEAFRTLKATAEGKTPYQITDTGKLQMMLERIGLDTSGSLKDQATRLADFLMDQLDADYDEPPVMVEKFAPEKRKKLWKEIAIYPAGVLHEIKDSVASCLTNVDGDHVSMAKKALRLGIACIYGAQLPLEMVQDILFGTPKPHEVNMDLGILDPDYVNIVFNGHEPWMGISTMLLARQPEWQEKARKAGAKGIHIVASIETGQELLQRFEMDDVFVGHTGNWLAIEPVLATGTIDVFAMDENCSPPGLKPYAEKYQIELVCVNDLVRIPGVDKILDYKPPEVESQGKQLIEWGISNFKKRKEREIEAFVPPKVQKAIAGFSTEAVLDAIGNDLDTLVKVIAENKIRGVVALVNCTTLANGPHDYMTTELTKELIKHNILVVSGGCGNHGLEVYGLAHTDALKWAGDGLREVCTALKIPPVLSFGTCTDTGRISMLTTALAEHLGVDTSDLPVAVTAPQYLEQKATIDAIFALAYGLYTHLSPTPPITGGDDLVSLLTDGLEGITGGKVGLGNDPAEAVSGILEHINKKRKALGLPV